MKTILAIALIVTIGTRASGQAPTVPVGRSAQTLKRFENEIFGILFNGIRLSSVQDSAAHAVIHESLVERERLGAIPTGSFRDEAAAIVKSRDARLRALIQTEPERGQFDVNAKERVMLLDTLFSRPPHSI